jgi:hypothetical protein
MILIESTGVTGAELGAPLYKVRLFRATSVASVVAASYSPGWPHTILLLILFIIYTLIANTIIAEEF